ncbi:L domain-like protein [Plenodomus tracheiphilus IPT5]|uniref:L domain-like protein n=1 Tax=Plenodomus tracheiphilus IPT5 TaxID=1408161 RepID=A0A6A7BC17_9PLEO|nr:L domain-like protein [Plenodomus tracheiphilus IPT5]
MDPASSIPRPSAIPRPASSRLPVLRPSGSQSRLRAPASTDQLRKKPSISSIGRPPPPPAASTLQKKSSRASLVRSNTPLTAAPAHPPANRASVISSRRASGIPSFGQPRTTTPSATPTNDAPVFRRPFTRPSSRQSKAPSQSTLSSSTTREDDTLGSLDGFRSASRASSRADSRAGFRDDEPESGSEHVLEHSPDSQTSPKKKSRPSLSERTIESLAQLPSSPAASKTRRRSSFFNADNTMGPPLRPASAMSSNSSRPTTSDGPPHPIPATPKRFGAASSRLSMTAPGTRTVSAGVAIPTATPSRTPLVSRPTSTVKRPLSLAQNLQNTPKPRPLSESKSLTIRTPKTRPSLGGVFGQAISPPGASSATPSTPSLKLNSLPKKTPDTSRRVSTSSSALRSHIGKAKAAQTSDLGTVTQSPPKVPSSSNALREQIAKAREAARRGKAEPSRTITPPRDAIVPDAAEIAGFDFGLDDPFNQSAKGGTSVMRKRIDGARVDGRLNLAAMGLKEVPNDVLGMYTYDPDNTTVAWGEVVDLGVMILADNELETIPDAMFPDVDVEDMIDSDEAGPQFGGVHTMDLHGNMLRELPAGLGRLSLLSKLNLSRNKLSMHVFDVVSRIHGIRELKLAENDLQGDLPASLCNLLELEVLDVQSNKITDISGELGHLTHLRSINITDNQLKAIPMELFESTSLIELQASKNRIEGTLFSIGAIAHLQELNVASNSILSLCEGDSIDLPAIKSIILSTNRLKSLPAVSGWTSLTTLLVGENKLTSLPEGFVDLEQLRTADFTGNDITQLDERIALMSNLTNLTFAANPLHVKKFLTMNTEDIKHDLASRLQPTEDVMNEDQETVFMNGIAEEGAVSKWQPTPSGTLDLSGQTMSEIPEAAFEAFVDDIRQLYLQQNAFTYIPTTLSLITHLTVLDLSKNALESALTTPLTLPKLRDLRLATNKLVTLDSLTDHLTAPLLQTLDVSHNRLSGALPVLTTVYPDLTTLLASDNGIADISTESLKGLKIVNLSNNDIERLEPRIGLLRGTLTGFEISGNKFRVPNWQVLGKGTDAVLAWLRDKIPRESWKSDDTEFFDADDTF